MSQNAIGLLASYLYVFAVLALGEVLRRWRGYPIEFTRKFVHVGVGMWAWGTVALFEDRLWAIIPPLTFVGLNYISYKRDLFASMETGEEGNLGTVYFPLSFAAAILWLWPWPALLVGALMVMTWGDATAAVVGKRWGKHLYRTGKALRSWEGSLAMMLAGWIAVTVALHSLGGLGLGLAMSYAGVVSAIATLVEGITPWQIDNLTVPLASGLILYWLLT